MYIGDGCNLECVKKKAGKGLPKVHEFIGPVKIVLVDTPPSVYRYKCCMAAALNMVYFCMGVVVMTITFYSLSFLVLFSRISHIFLCTIGWQLLIPCGMMSLNPLNGSTAVMNTPHRRYEHMFTMFFGIGYAIIGALFSLPMSDEVTFHSITGGAATIIGCVTAVSGPIAFFGITFKNDTINTIIEWCKTFHMILGVAGFACSSLCFITGIWRPQIRFWFPQQHMAHFLALFCIYYTVLVCASPVIKWKEERDKKKADELSDIKVTADGKDIKK